MRKLLTLDDLYAFYLNQNKSCKFSSKDTDETIVVHVNELLTFDSSYDPEFGLLKVHLKSCHLYRNRNGSSISEDSMNEAIPSFKNRPILGKIHKLSDGSYDFAGHEMTINDDGEVEYEEIPVGVIPESCNAQLVYDEEKQKTYLEVDGYIYEEYTRAANILREKGECKVSVEISVDEMSYSVKDKVLNIDRFHFLGVTILGTTDDEKEQPIEEGMYGSNIKIQDFSKECNSVFSNTNEEMMGILEKISKKIDRLANFSINQNFQKGGNEVGKFNELLAKYNKTVDEIEFDYSEMSDEELEAKFAELFDSAEEVGADPEEPASENDVEVDVATSETETETEIEVEDVPGAETEEIIVEKSDVFSKLFSISHEDIRCALYELLIPYEEADNDYYYISAVYDDYFCYEGWCSDAIYGQKYTKENDVVAFDGERYALHRELLTDSEYLELQNMRANYSSIQSKLANYEKAELNAKRNDVLCAEEYSVLAENAEFIELKKNMENYSPDELSREADLIFAKHVKATKNFSFASNSSSRKHATFFSASSNTDKEVNEPYGGLFKDYDKQK